MKNSKIQYYFIIASLLFMFIIPSFKTFAFQNEPDGFRGIQWGTNLKTLKGMSLVEDGGNSKFYKKKGDKMKIGNADLDTLAYGFYKGRFYYVIIRFNEIINASAIKETLFQQYGEGYRGNKFVENYLWTGTDVNIMFDYNEISKKGKVFYFYKPIQQQENSDNANDSKKGASDL